MILDNSVQRVEQWSDGPRVYFTLDYWDLRIYSVFMWHLESVVYL